MEPAIPGIFRIIAEYTYDWESWVDGEGRPRWINSALERITGYSVDAWLERPDYPLGLAHVEDRALLARVLADAAAGGSGNDVEFRVVRKDGTPRWVAISWQSVHGPDGERLGYRTSVRDIEERKRIEAELHVMRRRAEAAVVARSELLANVSHELRSPVHCISGFAELLADSPLDERQRRYVELIARECASMSRHVEDLLQLAALEAGGARLESRAFDLEELVRGVVEGERTIAESRGLELVQLLVLDERWVEGDPLRIGQIVRNLVDNALKFTERGEVRVIARSHREADATRVELCVEDTGSGMDSRDVARLMEPFQQATGTSTRRHGGVGLGLAIVQRLVNAMRGELSVDSALGVGTRVSVSLRLGASAAVAEGAAPRVAVDHHGERALVVDDSAPARELLAALLARHGYQVVEADSGEAALTLAASAEFDLVMLDYQMPNADGAEVAVALRRLFAMQKQKPAIYLLTANVFAREQLASARWAIDGILEKPVSRDELAALLTPASRAARRARIAHRQRLRALLDERVVEDLRTLRNRDGVPLFPALLARAGVDQEKTLDALEVAARQGSLREVARCAHAVAGQAGMLGAHTVARRARSLEQRAEEGELTAAAGLGGVAALRRVWGWAHEALGELV